MDLLALELDAVEPNASFYVRFNAKQSVGAPAALKKVLGSKAVNALNVDVDPSSTTSSSRR